ncbi:MAG: CpsD/CapB family tyrosine-protein kinase [Pseudomonadota bacterium]
MSKIEDALNKARIEGNNYSPRQSSSKNTELVSSAAGNNSSQLAIRSDYQEIVLMNDSELLDTDQLSDLGIIYSGMSDRKQANNYRDIRTKLIQKNNGNNFIVMITSCYSEDVSEFTLNLATAFTFDESKTSLLIDTNLHSSDLDNKLNLESNLGLTDYLTNDEIDIESIVLRSGIKRLRVIPVGTQNETVSECFTSLKMRDLMSDLLSRYSDRYIFINSAPVKDSADTRILLELCDYVVLTVPYGTSSVSSIKDAADAIGENKLLGVVFNDIPNLASIKIPGLRSNKKNS